MRNNWRPYATTAVYKAKARVTTTDVIWQDHKSKVEAELKTMLKLDAIDWKDQKVFRQRTAACKRVLDNMTLRDRAHVDVVVEKRRSEGNMPEVQRA